MCVCVRVYCLYKTFLKTKCQVSNFFTKKITLELKLKWDTFLWIGGVGYLTPFPHATKLQSPKSLVETFGLP